MPLPSPCRHTCLCNWKFKGKVGFRCELRLQVWFDQWFSQFWSFKVCFVLRLAYFIMVKQLMQFQASKYIFSRTLPSKYFCHSNSPYLSWLRLHALNQGFWTQGENEKVKVAQLCQTLCDPMDWAFHGILQARILEWVAFPFYRESSQPRDWKQVSHIAGRFFTNWALREALENLW